jgi:hypothetical protein
MHQQVKLLYYYSADGFLFSTGALHLVYKGPESIFIKCPGPSYSFMGSHPRLNSERILINIYIKKNAIREIKLFTFTFLTR